MWRWINDGWMDGRTDGRMDGWMEITDRQLIMIGYIDHNYIYIYIAMKLRQVNKIHCQSLYY